MLRDMGYDVTIGIPVYQVEQYICKSLLSALNQTYPNIEFLLVDDCGDDRSMALVDDIKCNHPRGRDIRILRQDRNMGVAQARNRIIDEAQGEYLYFMDSDDIISENAIALLIDTARNHDAEIVFGSYQKIEVYNNGKRTEKYQYPFMQLLSENELAAFAYRKYGGIQSSACNYLVRLSILRDSGLKFINTNYWEDMAFTFELVTYIHRAVLLPDVTYYYMCRYDSLSNYQRRESIGKPEILRNITTVDYMKKRTVLFKDKPYYPNRCYNVVMTGFYVICNILKNRKLIKPPFSTPELHGLMRHPATLAEIIRFRQAMLKNLLLYILGKMPASACIFMIKMMGKLKGLT